MAEQNVAPPYRWTFTINHLLERIAFTRAKAVVTFSSWARESVIINHGIDPEKVHAISPGVPLDRFPSSAPSRHLESTPRVRRILFVGGEFERKGGPTLVRVFLSRFAQRTNVELHIVTGNRALVPLHDRIFVHSSIGAYTPEWHALYNSADVLVLPTHREPFGHVYLEAAASWLPVIGSSVGAGPELIEDKKTGFVVDPTDEQAIGDRLALILENDELATTLGAAGRAKVNVEHNSHTNALRLAQLFMSIVQHH